MRTLLVFCLLLCGYSAIAQSPRPPRLKQPHKSKADPQVWDATLNGSGTGLIYQDSAECAAKFIKDAALNRWKGDELLREQAAVPRGGYLHASWARSTIGAASADSFVILAEAADGKEIVRWKPAATIPHSLYLFGVTVYSDFALVPLEKPLPNGARVYIIDNVSQMRFEYIIHP